MRFIVKNRLCFVHISFVLRANFYFFQNESESPFPPIYLKSAGAVEYTNCFSAER